MAYLDDHPPVRSQFRDPRREQPSGVVIVHTAENVMDQVGLDTGAEGVAHFISVRDTPGSYHELVDSDSTINVVRWDCEAFHDGTGSNPHSFGLSFACRTTNWQKMSAPKRDGFLQRGAYRAAAYARWMKSRYGIDIPATRISKAESDAKVPGFLSHAQRDPQRRSDPGMYFPWTTFLNMYRAIMDPTDPTPPEDPMANRLIVKGDKPEWWITDGITKRHVNDKGEAGGLVFAGLAQWDTSANNGKGGPYPYIQAQLDDITVVPRGKTLT